MDIVTHIKPKETPRQPRGLRKLSDQPRVPSLPHQAVSLLWSQLPFQQTEPSREHKSSSLASLERGFQSTLQWSTLNSVWNGVSLRHSCCPLLWRDTCYVNCQYTLYISGHFYEQQWSFYCFLGSNSGVPPPDLDTASAKVWMNTRSVEYVKAGVSPNIEVSKFCRAAKKSQKKFRTKWLHRCTTR